jgi:metal-responsive CopG/Arc/MetJ family transcriptional regulator
MCRDIWGAENKRFLLADTRFLAVLHGSPATTTHHRRSHEHRDALFALGAAVTGTAIVTIILVEGSVLPIRELAAALLIMLSAAALVTAWG